MSTESHRELLWIGRITVYVPRTPSNCLRTKIQDGVEKGEDPSPKVRHKDLKEFLANCVQNELPESVLEVFAQAQDLRVFINYGPRVRWPGKGPISVNTCAVTASEVTDLQSKMDQVFHETIIWACDNGTHDGLWVPALLTQVGSFFEGSHRFYVAWCTDEEAAMASSLRESMYELARQRVMSKESGNSGA